MNILQRGSPAPDRAIEYTRTQADVATAHKSPGLLRKLGMPILSCALGLTSMLAVDTNAASADSSYILHFDETDPAKATDCFIQYGDSTDYASLAEDVAVAYHNIPAFKDLKDSTKQQVQGRMQERALRLAPGTATCDRLADNYSGVGVIIGNIIRNGTLQAETVYDGVAPIVKPAARGAGNILAGALECGGGWESKDGCEPYTAPYTIGGTDSVSGLPYFCSVESGPNRTDNYKRIAKAIKNKFGDLTGNYSVKLETYVKERLRQIGGKYDPDTAYCDSPD